MTTFTLSFQDVLSLRKLIELNSELIARGEQPIYSRCDNSISNMLYGPLPSEDAIVAKHEAELAFTNALLNRTLESELQAHRNFAYNLAQAN